jgi:branched-chain amino acid transport system ATP-binding protein
VIVQQIGRTIRKLKAEGFTILLVEQNFRFAATVADRHYVMDHGRVVDMIPNSELDANMDKLHEYLGSETTRTGLTLARRFGARDHRRRSHV